MSNEKDTDTTPTGVAEAEEEFDAAWEEELPEETPSEEPEDDGDTPDDDQDDDSPPANSDSPPKEHDFEKRFKDTQAAFTKSQQENKDLRDRLERLESEKQKQEEPPEPPDSLKELAEDDPALLEAIRYEIAHSRGELPEDVTGLVDEVKTLREELAQSRFNAAVLGGYIDPESKKYVKGHPDAFELMATDEFETFFGDEVKKNPSLDSDAMSPSEAISLIGRFKEAVASRSADNYDRRTADGKRKADEALSDGVDETQGRKGSARPGSSAAVSLTEQEAEFDAAWDEF